MLLVEDSEPAIIQMTEVLRASGYVVDVARGGAAALDRLTGDVPEAVILDLMMPDMDGFEVLRKLRGSPRTALVPVLILTAKQVTEEELSFLEGNHIHQLLQKGDVDKAGLLAAVAEMVAPAPRPAPPLRRRPRPGTLRPVVLVVEDNADNMRTARAILEDRYEILEAWDGRAALDVARRRLPDAILLDIALPELDGTRVVRAIREDPTLADTPVFAVTASAMSGDREKILAHGFDAYITKPIDHELILRKLTEALGA